MMVPVRTIAWLFAIALAMCPTLSAAQSVPLPSFPPGLFAGRGAIDAPSGSGASIAPLFGQASTGGASPLTIGSGIVFSTGVVGVGIAQDRGGGAVGAPTAVTINGVAATQIGTTVSDGTQNGVSCWYAPVTAGTGNVTITNVGGFGETAANGWMITGNLSNIPTANSSFNGFSPTQADPQGPMSLTVASGGVAMAVVGSNFKPVTVNPTTWVAATRDALTEAENATGNEIAIAGAHITGAGTFGIEASGTTSWLYSGMCGAAWQ